MQCCNGVMDGTATLSSWKIFFKVSCLTKRKSQVFEAMHLCIIKPVFIHVFLNKFLNRQEIQYLEKVMHIVGKTYVQHLCFVSPVVNLPQF